MNFKALNSRSYIVAPPGEHHRKSHDSAIAVEKKRSAEFLRILRSRRRSGLS